MQIAYLILCHHHPGQLGRLLHRLQSPRANFYIHVDGRQAVTPFEQAVARQTITSAVHFIKNRVSCRWGTYSLLEATLLGLWQILKNPRIDYIVLLSGQDYPIKPVAVIEAFFAQHAHTVFMESFTIPTAIWEDGGRYRFPYFDLISKTIQLYGGSQWWSMPAQVAVLLCEQLKKYRWLASYFKKTIVPDESMFQTILRNITLPSAFTIVNNHLRYLDWSNGGPHPALLTLQDFEALSSAAQLFARKFDEKIDADILSQIDQSLLMTAPKHAPTLR